MDVPEYKTPSNHFRCLMYAFNLARRKTNAHKYGGYLHAQWVSTFLCLSPGALYSHPPSYILLPLLSLLVSASSLGIFYMYRYYTGRTSASRSSHGNRRLIRRWPDYAHEHDTITLTSREIQRSASGWRVRPRVHEFRT